MISKANTHNTIGGSRISATNGKKRKLGIWIGCENMEKLYFEEIMITIMIISPQQSVRVV